MGDTTQPKKTRTPTLDLLHRKMIDALAELAASLIRNGGDPQAVQRWVDGELDRIEAIASQGAHRQDH